MVSLPLDDIKSHILWKLHIRRIWGGKHTAIENVAKGVQNHLRGDYIEMAKKLIKHGFILSKPTSYGQQISLNPRKMEEIIKLVTEFANKTGKHLI
ncbi:MAG: hypothetical protein HYW23_01070 [Candidatus Aenigmarchaeota archaeon]|nr:hypothetical protein [Candidatus Aenigmarchaeota archaeon]